MTDKEIYEETLYQLRARAWGISNDLMSKANKIKDLIERIESLALKNILSWASIKKSIDGCEVTEVFQAHSREVSVRLKNGIKLTSVEPNIDDIIDLAVAAEPKCGSVRMATE